ncbi:hypothetical protein [Geodermatophilus amargosae]|nr:hypothetical protein [Geodermatophilus amargosae]
MTEGDQSQTTRDGKNPTSRPKKWYQRTWTWISSGLAAAVAALLVTQGANLINKGTDTLSPPIDVSVRAVKDCPFTYVIPGDAGSTPPPPPLEAPNLVEEREKWAAQLGGVDADATRIDVTVRGKSDDPVKLEDLQIDVVGRSEPIRGFVGYSICGDVVEVRYISIDLDRNPPAIVATGDDSGTEKPVDFPYEVSSTEVESFSIFVSTSTCNCEWRARLLWTSGSRSGEVTMDDDGTPFRTHGGNNLPRFQSQGGKDPWKPEGS